MGRRPVGVRSRREVRGGGRRPRAANETPAARRSASSMRTQEPGVITWSHQKPRARSGEEEEEQEAEGEAEQDEEQRRRREEAGR